MGYKGKKKLIKSFKEIGVVRKESVKLKHAGGSGIYFDVKKAYGYPKFLNTLCEKMWGMMDKRANCIAAAGYGGLPLAAALASRYGVKLVLVREKSKEHGRNATIDGYVPNRKDKIWIVDDVFTTGKSIHQVAKVLARTQAKVMGCSVVVRRSKQKLAIPCRYLINAEDLM